MKWAQAINRPSIELISLRANEELLILESSASISKFPQWFVGKYVFLNEITQALFGKILYAY